MKSQHLIPLLFSLTTLALPTSNPKIRAASEKRTHSSSSSSSSPNNDDPPIPSCQIPHNYDDTKSYCIPPVKFNDTLLDSYLCGDSRLGPIKLPSIIPLVSTISFYHRFGPSHLCPAEFLNKYWNFDATNPGRWSFPNMMDSPSTLQEIL
ncbi:hypothetical protein V8F06_007679 [Rhypophila decipiens]